jgi:hypothetical protein
MSKDPFDFSDVSDLPEDLQKKLHTDSDENAREYAAVVVKGAEAGFAELTINQIMAAAMRMGMVVPTQPTVRSYLNEAVKLGLISKPGRLTYGAPEEQAATPAPKAKPKAKAEAKAEEAAPDPVDAAEVPSAPQEAPAPEPTEDEDPLASLGL